MDNSSFEEPTCSSPSVRALFKLWLFLYISLLPLFLYVLYVGYKQWQKQKSALSHSDVFTFTIISMEVLAIVATIISYAGYQNRNGEVRGAGNDLYYMGIAGQMFIHCLTCVERYLAVVHPITYLHLKKRGGVMIRNVSIASVWFLTVLLVGLSHTLTINSYPYIRMCMLVLAFFTVTVVVFCSISVLCVLIRAGPGKGGGDLSRVDQSKRRAFITIMIILGVLVVRFVFCALSYLGLSLGISSQDDPCLFAMAVCFLNFPSSVVLPLMFLHKARKLPKGCVFNKRK